MNETIGHILIGVGVAFDVLGCLGLVRLPDVYNRLQAATKNVTLGTCMILVGAGIASWGNSPLVIKAFLCAAFILLTAPVGAHALARGAYRSRVSMFAGSVVDEYEGEAPPADLRDGVQASGQEQTDAQTEAS